MTESSNTQPRIFIWCWPRTVSTALGKCLSNVEGVQYWHEPYQNSLSTILQMKIATEQQQKPVNSKFIEIMGKLGQVMASSDASSFFADSKLFPSDKFTYPWVKEKLEEDEPGKDFIVIKDMAMSIVENEQYLPKVPSRHVFLIRHPLRIAMSMTTSIKNICKFIGEEDVDFEIFRDTLLSNQAYFQRDHAYVLWQYVRREKLEQNPIIIDSDDLCRWPEKILPKFFKGVGIPYHEKYLSWGKDEEILKSWKGSIGGMVAGKAMKSYDRAFQSSCFVAPKADMPNLDEIPDFFKENCDSLLKSYQEMYEHRLREDD